MNKKTKLLTMAALTALAISAGPARSSTLSPEIASMMPPGLLATCERLHCRTIVSKSGEELLWMRGDWTELERSIRRNAAKRWKHRFWAHHGITSTEDFAEMRGQWRRVMNRKIMRWSRNNGETMEIDAFMSAIASTGDPGTPSTTAIVPLPAGIFLLGGGLAVLGATRRRKQRPAS